MDSATGHFLFILFSITLLFDGAVSKAHQRERNDSNVASGRQQILAVPALYNESAPVHPASQHVKHGNGQSHRARADIHLDLGDIAEEIGIPVVNAKMSQMDGKIDDMHRLLKDMIQNEIARNRHPGIKTLEAEVAGIAQAMPALLSNMQAVNEQLKAQKQVIQESYTNRCDSRGFEQVIQALTGEVATLTQAVKQLRVQQSTGTKAVHGVVTRHSQLLEGLQQIVAQTVNTCSACLGKAAPASPLARSIYEAELKLVTQVQALPEALMNAVQKTLRSHALEEKKQRVAENNSVIQYLTDLANKMMDYRDDYLKKLIDHGRKMDVIEKTVTQTTRVLQKAANGAQNATRALMASRSLTDGPKCNEEKKKTERK